MSTPTPPNTTSLTAEHADGQPRHWRDRPVHQALDTAMRTGDQPSAADLDALTAAAEPEITDGFRDAVTAAAAELIDLYASGQQGPARDRLRALAADIDERFRTADARADQAADEKTARRRARDADLDPERLAADATGHDFRSDRRR